ECCETQPELVAHHYTEAALPQPAVGYWQRAGQRALERSANLEAVAHLSKGLTLLQTLPDTATRTQHELDLQITLGPALVAIKGFTAPEVEQTYARARALCHQVGQTPQLFPTLGGLWRYYAGRGAFQTARELGEQLLTLAQSQDESMHLLVAHTMLGHILF